MRNAIIRRTLTAVCLASLLTAGSALAATRDAQVRDRDTTVIERIVKFAKKIVKAFENPTLPHPKPEEPVL